MYKRVVAGLLLVVGLLGIAPPAKADTQDFSITSFTADYYVSRDAGGVSHMRVREEITAQFPAIDQNHGILRALPQTYDGHNLELAVDTVSQKNGAVWPYSTYTENNNLVLKIGDADTFVHGEQVYVVEYTLRGVVDVAHSGLFWDVNGDQWPQSFGRVQARVHLPADLTNAVQGEPRCFTGSFGSTATNCTVSHTLDNNTTTFAITTTTPLAPHETLTFEIPFSKGTFAPYSMSPGLLMQTVAIGAGLAAPSLIALAIAIRTWRHHGRDAKAKGVVVPQYVPPKEVSVLGASAVVSQQFRPGAISATIVDLAVRHYIKIYETGKKTFGGHTYELELVKDSAGLRPEEQAVIALLFGGQTPGQRVALESLSKTLYTKAQKIGQDVEDQVTAAGYFVRHPGKARRPFYIVGAVVAILGVVFPPYTLGLLPAGIILLIAGAVMGATTQKGAEFKNYVLGLKMYMQLVEAQRLKALQSPQGALTQKIDVANKGQLVKVYERLLPYAMLFGIEKDWAKQFAHLYEQPPEWYAGTSAFNVGYFAGAVASLDTAMTTSFSPPSSSSGGGSAGGGGGGGGGGGW